MLERVKNVKDDDDAEKNTHKSTKGLMTVL